MTGLKFIAASIAVAMLSASVDASPHPHGGGPWHGGGRWHGSGHWHGHIGLFIGVPWYAPYYPEVIAAIPPPVVYYAEQNPDVQRSAAPLPSGWWYYCPNPPAGYYPSVPSCSQPWQPVQPLSPSPQ